MKSREPDDQLLIEEIDSKVLKHYLSMRRQFDFYIETIQGITRALTPLMNSDDDSFKVNSTILGQISRVLDKHATSAWDTLDDFIPVAFAQLALSNRKNLLHTRNNTEP